MQFQQVVGDFRGALLDPHTINLRENVYLLFGMAWGITFPFIFLVAHLYLTGEPIDAVHMLEDFAHYRLNYVLIALPVVLGVIFGACGTIRRDTESELQRTISALDTQVSARTQDLRDTYTETVLALSKAIEAKDPYTRGHCYRVWRFAERAARTLNVSPEELEELRFACYLHDVGKIRVPGRVLNKNGPLTDEEYNIVKQHSVFGQQIVAPIRRFTHVATLIRHHHERCDGSGYPDGLVDAEIPLLAKLMAAADTVDAMTSLRPYRQALPRAAAIAELRRCAGLAFDADAIPGGRLDSMHHFDPAVVEAMVDGLNGDIIDDGALTEPTEAELRLSAALTRKAGDSSPRLQLTPEPQAHDSLIVAAPAAPTGTDAAVDES